jgi:hypothetical protein
MSGPRATVALLSRLPTLSLCVDGSRVSSAQTSRISALLAPSKVARLLSVLPLELKHR